MTETALCPSSVQTLPEDFQRFGEDMPTGEHPVTPVMSCELPQDHNGPHLYGIQVQGPGPSDPEEAEAVHWWAVWGEGQQQPYSVTTMDICPEPYEWEGSEAFLCCLPLGHDGPHGPGAPDRPELEPVTA